MSKSVSVIIPVYNVSDYIIRCINSVINQTYTHIECLLIDDCSTDNSSLLIEQMLRTQKNCIKFVLIKHEQNKGVAEARNTGIINASGDYLYFLDGDDEITPDCIETLVNLCKKEEEMIIGDFQLSGIHALGTKLNLKKPLYCNEDIFNAYTNQQWYDMPWNKLINRNFILKNKLFFSKNLTTNQDALWSFLIATKLQSLSFTTKETYIYHVRNGSISTTPNLRKIDNQLFILNEIVNVSLTLPYNVSNFIAAFAINMVDIIYYKTLVPLAKKELFYSYLKQIKAIIEKYPFLDLNENVQKGLSLIIHPSLCNIYCQYKQYRFVATIFHRIIFKFI